MKLFNYCGYDVVATDSGGKAGRGRNKTASVQVRQGGFIVKTFSYATDEDGGLRNATLRAKSHIDKLEAEP